MKRPLRIFISIVLALVAIFIAGVVSVNYFIKNKVETFIETGLPDNILHSYKDIDVHALDGSITLNDASVILKNKTDSVKHTFVHIEKLKIADISYWDYLINKQIHIKSIQLERPKITYYRDRLKKSQDTTRKPLVQLHKPVIIDGIEINRANLGIYVQAEDSTKLFTKNLTVHVTNIRLDNKTLSKKLPVEFSGYAAKTDSIFVKVSKYDNLTVGNLEVENNNMRLKKIKLQTKYSRSQLFQNINKERDHYNLRIDSLSVQKIDFGFINDSKFFAKTRLIKINSPNLNIFRDKLVADDETTKPLYSKMLRQLPIALTVDSLKIENGSITYSEKVKEGNPAGSISFSNLNATMENVSNTYKAPTKTNIHINAHFMEKTPFTVDWNFNVEDESDQFIFKAEMGAMMAERMNNFTRPNLRVKLEGHTNKTFFTIDGNNDTSTTDMKISYSDFKVTVLDKEGKGKNGFLSTVANIFISKDSTKKNDYYREGTADATRNKSKSFFNFLWISIKGALLKSMTGHNKD